MTILASPTRRSRDLAMMNWVMARLIPISVVAAVVALHDGMDQLRQSLS